MDFVECLFGLSPDGGSGMFEALILCAAIAVLAAIARGVRSILTEQSTSNR